MKAFFCWKATEKKTNDMDNIQSIVADTGLYMKKGRKIVCLQLPHNSYPTN